MFFCIRFFLVLREGKLFGGMGLLFFLMGVKSVRVGRPNEDKKRKIASKNKLSCFTAKNVILLDLAFVDNVHSIE